MDNINRIFPTAPNLDQDLNSVGGMLLEMDREISGSLEFSEYFAKLHKPAGKIGIYSLDHFDWF